MNALVLPCELKSVIEKLGRTCTCDRDILMVVSSGKLHDTVMAFRIRGTTFVGRPGIQTSVGGVVKDTNSTSNTRLP